MSTANPATGRVPRHSAGGARRLKAARRRVAQASQRRAERDSTGMATRHNRDAALGLARQAITGQVTFARKEDPRTW